MLRNSFVLDGNQADGADLIHLAPAAAWDSIGASEHFVQFYEHDSSLLDSVCAFFAKGLRKNEPCLIIATKAHREGLQSRLSEEGFDIEDLRANGTFIALDAAETLGKFMINGLPDAARFQEIVGGLVARTSARASGLRAFGEMVALLCAEGNSKAAIQLEELWNDLGKKYTFALFCAYPLGGFQNECDGQPFGHICKCHTRVIPAESYSRDNATVDDRLRIITQLQQKAATLEVEIANRKRCQDDLARREAELKDFLENATEGIHQVASDGKILWANRAELEMLGYSPEEYIGHAITDFHADAPVIKDILGRLLRGEKLHDFEARLKHKDGSLRYVSINSSGRWDEGKFSYTRCFTRDITDRKRASDLLEATVAQRTAQLQETVADLEAFSYSISHDMRSPLRAMQAYAASLLEDYQSKLDADGANRLSRIQRAAGRMDLLIRDVLAYSKVAKGEIDLKPIALAPLVNDLLDQQFGLNPAKQTIIVEELDTVLGHEAYLTQCFSNLIDNALKFVPPGQHPCVRVRSETKGDQVRISVTDNGIGIRPEHRDRIFKIFGRIHPDTDYEGTGIGLAIVQKAVTRMGGEVGVDSEPGRGSHFWFTLRRGEVR